MRVLQVNFSDYAQGGGGTIAMYRLHQGLKQAGVAGKILCGLKTLDSDESVRIPQVPRWENRLKRFTQKLGLNDIDRVGSFKIQQLEAFQEADILNFHVIHSGFFNYLAIPKLTQSKPAVMTLHDMWAFTGHCAYSYDCDRWKTGCGRCPYPQTEPAVKRDSTNLEWRLKHWVYNRANLQIVAPSRWLVELAKQSLLNCFPIHHIPYGIDTNCYQPLDPGYCRSALGILPHQKVLMFAAARLNDSRKGFDLLIQALNQLPNSLKQETVLLVIGDSGEAIAKPVDMPVINLGFVQHDRFKAIAYSAADLFVFPTRADNLPLVLQESMACGTPMVSFKVGGIGDLVRPGLTGYLAESENAEDFCNGIVQLLEDQTLRQQMRQQCRAIALEEFELGKQTQQYIDIYEKSLKS